ncbi:helix-turn-helix transcriptional regulator [Blastomonas sp. CCH5-A3]|jgi:DNA-binding CsgD family transcriptional regulator|uniref:helix-turn-helix transcriptional regulator n=1 Tax=Blastomonas sp. CCH5-A3 TaxID=1768761 RepID=UPI000826C13F|nr:helix-turn-helix transcriptional regulator [Blastomonas sp. CCH5-A3]
MILLSNRFDRLDELIADAALGHCTWSDALTRMLPLAGADAMLIGVIFGDNRMIRPLGTANIDQAVVDAYAEHFYRIGPRARHGMPPADHGIILHDELRRPDDIDEQDEFWAWYDSHNPPSDASMLIMPCIGDARIGLVILRRGAQASQADIAEFYQRFYDKFSAINLSLRRKVEPEQAATAMVAQLQQIDTFSLIVDEDMQVAADELSPMIRYTLPLTGLARLDEDGRLGTILPDFQSALTAMIQNPGPGQVMDLTLKTGLADTMVRVVSLPQSTALRSVKVDVTYMKHAQDPVKVFMGALGLTKREAELLDVLRRVDALDEAAALMAISRNTARVFLAQIFERTGVRRKADLLRLAGSFA